GFLHIVGFIIDLCITGMFAILGYFGRKRNRWPFIIGMILYFADGIVMLLFQDWIGVLFHFIALSGIWNGFRSLGELGVLEKSSATESIEILRQRIPSLNLQSPSQQKIIRWVFVGLILLILVPFFLFLFWLFQYQH
ncbi:MAG TPA: hypothetical protein VHM28_10900, partial [Anaerolineales bacterium]|nr:hypothetical protein [Anaerolineales bacterium]